MQTPLQRAEATAAAATLPKNDDDDDAERILLALSAQ